MVIIRKVEAMTCTRITVAPYDPLVGTTRVHMPRPLYMLRRG
jgi:hypothetical protein